MKYIVIEFDNNPKRRNFYKYDNEQNVCIIFEMTGVKDSRKRIGSKHHWDYTRQIKYWSDPAGPWKIIGIYNTFEEFIETHFVDLL